METTYTPNISEDQSVKIIGLGGIGSIVARYAGVFLASLNTPLRLVLIDGDHFEHSNATRMLFDEHGNKAAVVHNELSDRIFDTQVTLVAIQEFVNPENIGQLIHDGDIVIVCVDNFATRSLISLHAEGLKNVTVISAGNDGVGEERGKMKHGTYGNCQIYSRKDGQDRCLGLTHHHPEIENPEDHVPGDAEDCTEAIMSTPQLLATNLMAASTVLNTLWLHLCGRAFYAELSFDIAEALMRPWPQDGPDPRSKT